MMMYHFSGQTKRGRVEKGLGCRNITHIPLMLLCRPGQNTRSSPAVTTLLYDHWVSLSHCNVNDKKDQKPIRVHLPQFLSVL